MVLSVRANHGPDSCTNAGAYDGPRIVDVLVASTQSTRANARIRGNASFSQRDQIVDDVDGQGRQLIGEWHDGRRVMRPRGRLTEGFVRSLVVVFVTEAIERSLLFAHACGRRTGRLGLECAMQFWISGSGLIAGDSAGQILAAPARR